MKVFLSWSGDRSKAAAETLGNWISSVIQAVEPWVSSGMEKGARWQTEIADRLEDARVGIVCLTSSNLSEPWILFEAGALSKTKGSYVCTFLLDIAPADIEPPLGQFQHTSFAKEEIFKLVQTINSLVETSGERSLGEKNLRNVFETFWPQLDEALRKIVNVKEAKIVPRSDRQLLEEVLEILRAQEQRRHLAPRGKFPTPAQRAALSKYLYPDNIPVPAADEVSRNEALRTYIIHGVYGKGPGENSASAAYRELLGKEQSERGSEPPIAEA